MASPPICDYCGEVMVLMYRTISAVWVCPKQSEHAADICEQTVERKVWGPE